jgi:Fur family peroxide stress response transcriptional regulator
MITDKKATSPRNTRQREAIARVLAETTSHPTAAWIYDKLKADFPDLSLGTVYRNLSFLSDRGLIRVLRSGSGTDRFDGNASGHYHVVCESCGKVEDIAMESDAALDERAETLSGYRVSSHRLDFFGVCPACRDRHTVS